MTYLILFLFIGTISLFSQHLTYVTDLSEEDFKIYFYEVFNDGKDLQNKLLVYYGSKNNEKYIVYDHNFNKIYEMKIGKHITRRKNYFRHNNKIYILEEKLFSIDLTNLEFDSTRYDFKSENSSLIQISINSNDDILICNTNKKVDVYNFTTFDKISSFNRELSLKYPALSIQANGIIVIKNKENELAAFDINTDKKRWYLNAGSSSVSFLGISLGTFEDSFKNYVLSNIDSSFYLYASTIFGNLYKIDLKSGKVLLQKNRFGGEGNNDGLLTSLYIEDMNQDGIDDIVGAAVDENMYCINGLDFSIIWEYDSGNEHQMPLALYDINGDKIKEVFGVNDYDNILSVVDGSTGELITEIDIKESDKFFQTYPVVKNFNEKGFVNMMVKTNPRNLRIFKIKVQQTN
jgi:outer membrane protein assembly factor BamB